MSRLERARERALLNRIEKDYHIQNKRIADSLIGIMFGDNIKTPDTTAIVGNPSWGYTGMAKFLDQFPQEAQEEFWKSYTWGIGISNADALGSYLASLHHVEWLTPQEQEPNTTQSLLDKHLDRLNMTPKQIHIEHFENERDFDTLQRKYKEGLRLYPPSYYDWKKEIDKAEITMQDAAEVTEREMSMKTVKTIASNILERKPLESLQMGTMLPMRHLLFWNAAKWITVEDQTELLSKAGYTKGNPFTPAVELCKNGYFLVGTLPENTNKFILLAKKKEEK